MDTILVGVAETATVDPHLRVAARLAGKLGATLHAVHAYRLPDPLLYPYMEAGTYDPDVARALHDGLIAQMEAAVAEVAPAARVLCRAVPLPADAAVVQVAEEVGADLIVVGATTRGALSRAILGNTAQRVVRGASVPVLVTRAESELSPGRVLTTTDLSAHSSAVHRRGLALIRGFGADEAARLRTLLVVGPELGAPQSMRPGLLEELRSRDLAAFLGSLGPPAAGAEGRVREGDPAREILAEAEEWKADLLLLGTHGRGGVSRFLIGSVAEAVLRGAGCDLLLIPAAALPPAADATTSPRE